MNIPFIAQQQPKIQKPKSKKPLNFIQFNTAPIIQSSNVKRQCEFDSSGHLELCKFIKDFKICITDYGNTVILEKVSGEFQATFLEENAQESEQCKIQISPSDIITDIQEQLKLVVGKDSSRSTKVIFLKGYRGIVIRWYTGLKTKFVFSIEE